MYFFIYSNIAIAQSFLFFLVSFPFFFVFSVKMKYADYLNLYIMLRYCHIKFTTTHKKIKISHATYK